MTENDNRRTAIVTGGSRGIGRAVCEALAAAGNNVVINYAGNRPAAEETAATALAMLQGKEWADNIAGIKLTDFSPEIYRRVRAIAKYSYKEALSNGMGTL